MGGLRSVPPLLPGDAERPSGAFPTGKSFCECRAGSARRHFPPPPPPPPGDIGDVSPHPVDPKALRTEAEAGHSSLHSWAQETSRSVSSPRVPTPPCPPHPGKPEEGLKAWLWGLSCLGRGLLVGAAPTPRARSGGCSLLDFGLSPYCCWAVLQSRAVPPPPRAPPFHPPPSSRAVCCTPVCFCPRPVRSLSRSGSAQPPVPFRKGVRIYSSLLGGAVIHCRVPPSHSSILPMSCTGGRGDVPWLSLRARGCRLSALRVGLGVSGRQLPLSLPRHCASVSPQPRSGVRADSTPLSPTPLRPTAH